MKPPPEFAAWHYQKDALPRLQQTDGGRFALHVIIGTWAAAVNAPAPSITLEWADSSSNVTGVVALKRPHGSAGGTRIVPLTNDFLMTSTNLYPESARSTNSSAADRKVLARPPHGPRRAYLLAALTILRTKEKNEKLQADHDKDPSSPIPEFDCANRYYEAVIADLPPLTTVTYHILVSWGATSERLGPFAVVTSLPSFEPEDMIGGRVGSFEDPGQSWIGHLRRTGDWTHLRVDLDDLPVDLANPAGATRIPLRIRAAGRWFDIDPDAVSSSLSAAVCEAKLLPVQLPLLDYVACTVTLSVHDPLASPVIIEAHGRAVRAAQAGHRGRARVMIINFWIQAINDLLEAPFSGGAYQPPRTYMQVSMLDEKGIYSSRPLASPGQDGYLYGLEAHRTYGVPYHLAVNGGVLTLLNHDCPDDLEGLRDDVANGIVHPAIAGFGAFRINYFTPETNRREVAAGAALADTLLGQSGSVFYPDQRLYRQGQATRAALTQPPVRYVVFDAATGYYDNEASIQTNHNADGIDVGPAMLWQDRTTGTFVLYIDGFMKDNVVSGTDEWKLGRPPIEVRRGLMRYALDPHLRDRNLLIYADDFDKGCGNGWFEGDSNMHRRYAAFLEWISGNRPWLQVVTVKDLDPVVDCVGSIDVKTAIDPVLDPGGRTSIDQNGNELHFDTWMQQWWDTEALWTGGTLGQITHAVETALTQWPQWARNELYETAWLAFLHCEHECMWSTQPESGDPNTDPLGEPEDFAYVEGLQVRNVLVWLKASVWAAWAAAQPPTETDSHVNGGPVFDLIRSISTEKVATDPYHFDADPMPTMVIYNSKALVVIDANGGRVSHAFTIRDGRPCTVSGTFKSYQYRDRNGVDCDGLVMQNTVWTPNHRYIGSDLLPVAEPRIIDWTELRPAPVNPGAPVDQQLQRLFPDNFNSYSCSPSSKTNSVTATPDDNTDGPPRLEDKELEGHLKEWLGLDGQLRRKGETGKTWHPWSSPNVTEPPAWTKTFTLEGSSLTVAYHNAPVGLVVDNEFCVDLYPAVTAGKTLTRTFSDSAEAEAVTITMPTDEKVTITTDTGCKIDAISRVESSASDLDSTALSKFLEIHRVLTDAVQVIADNPEFRYKIDLGFQPTVASKATTKHNSTAPPPTGS